MKDILRKGHAEKNLGIINVPKKHQRVHVCDAAAAEYRPRLENNLVRAEIVALEKDKLVLVG